MGERKMVASHVSAPPVKPLVWEEPSRKNNNVWVARTVLGTYCVGCEGGWWYAVMDEGYRPWEWESPQDARSYSGPHDFMEACQADYASRILSALDLTTLSLTGRQCGDL